LCLTCSRPKRVSVQVGAGSISRRFAISMPRAPSPNQLNVWTDLAEVNALPVVDVAARARHRPQRRGIKHDGYRLMVRRDGSRVRG
jgi:hypothetical protein